MKKNKKNNNEEKMENFLDVLIRNYKTVPGVKIVLKLALYFIFIIIFVIVISVSNYSKKDNNNNITMVKSNVLAINEIISDVAVKIQEDIDNRGRENIEIAIRQFYWV